MNGLKPLGIPRFALGAAMALALGTGAMLPATVQAAEKDEQSAARENVERGNMKIRDIEAKVLPRMKGKRYLGFTYFPVENVYVLRFMDKAKVTDVEVDARTGEILWQSK